IISVFGIIITAGYILWTVQRIYLGNLQEKHKTLEDLTLREMLAFVPLIILIILLGIYPAPAIELMNASLSHLVELVTQGV
ncbi:MAG: NADH-quinone oxidoreductase subunit M, partial [Bacteroidota bacterium]